MFCNHLLTDIIAQFKFVFDDSCADSFAHTHTHTNTRTHSLVYIAFVYFLVSFLVVDKNNTTPTHPNTHTHNTLFYTLIVFSCLVSLTFQHHFFISLSLYLSQFYICFALFPNPLTLWLSLSLSLSLNPTLSRELFPFKNWTKPMKKAKHQPKPKKKNSLFSFCIIRNDENDNKQSQHTQQ